MKPSGVCTAAVGRFRSAGDSDRGAAVPGDSAVWRAGAAVCADFLLAGRNGGACVVNVKPADQLAVPKVAEALAWAGEVLAARGARFSSPARDLTNWLP
jgi:hypothetical protein